MARGERRGMNGGSGDGIVRGRGEKGPKGSILILFAGLSPGGKNAANKEGQQKSTRVIAVNKVNEGP